MRRLFLLIIFSIVTSCGIHLKVISLTPRYIVSEKNIYPGRIKKIMIEVPNHLISYKINCLKDLPVKKEGRFLSFFFSVAISYIENKNKLIIPCYLKGEADNQVFQIHILNLNIKRWKYPVTKLSVNKKHIDLSPKNLERYLKERKIIQKIYEDSKQDKIIFHKEFIRPLESKVTSLFGSQRVYNNKKKSIHTGTDFRARVPTEIPTSNDGIVIFTGNLFFTGKTVIINHGVGITTMYCHLSRIQVKKRQVVKRNDILGLSGNTGRSTAPHLHWGVRNQGDWVDGLAFVESQKEKEIIYMMNSNDTLVKWR